MSLSPEIRNRIFSNVKKRVVENHFNAAGVDYEAWLNRLDQQKIELLSTDDAAFEDAIRNLLLELRSSHTAFYHAVPTRFPPQHTINATLTRLEQNGCYAWMFLDVFPDGPAHAAGINRGDLLQRVDGIDQTSPEMPAFAIGKTHRLSVYRGASAACREVEVHVPKVKATKQRPPIVEPRSVTHALLRPGMGLLKIVYFSGALGMRFTSELDRAVLGLKAGGCDRLIVDLRGNIGGSLGFARLASYLCPDRRPIGHSLTPRRLRTGYTIVELPQVAMPQNRFELALALTRFAVKDKSLMLLTQGLGVQPFHGRTVLLVNEWTNSAAEIIAAFAREHGLAPIVGQKTRGNVLGAANFSVGGGYWLRLPVFGWFTSKGETVEGIGVNPDVGVQTSLNELQCGQDTQLTRATEIAEHL